MPIRSPDFRSRPFSDPSEVRFAASSPMSGFERTPDHRSRPIVHARGFAPLGQVLTIFRRPCCGRTTHPLAVAHRGNRRTGNKVGECGVRRRDVYAAGAGGGLENASRKSGGAVARCRCRRHRGDGGCPPPVRGRGMRPRSGKRNRANNRARERPSSPSRTTPGIFAHPAAGRGTSNPFRTSIAPWRRGAACASSRRGFSSPGHRCLRESWRRRQHRHKDWDSAGRHRRASQPLPRSRRLRPLYRENSKGRRHGQG
ncbi:hypothetical protein BIWAKO_05868 [Bosea sp. BIWAKO-01]|nr:hypothetical protein BIWAKO_05868 [Bosea sp. BIWAKO-01]